MRRYYEILGVPPSATQEEIKSAWIFSIKAFHPDKFAGSSAEQKATAERRTQIINEAYEILSNPIKRTEYDRERGQESKRQSASAASPPEPPPPAPPPVPPASTAH